MPALGLRASCRRRRRNLPSPRFPTCAVLLGIAVSAGSISVCRAEDPAELPTADAELGDAGPVEEPVFEPPGRRPARRRSNANDDRVGIDGRLGHFGFPTFGRNESITHVELLPHFIAGDQMLFGDLRLFMSNQARFGGNAGLGYRTLVPEWDRVFGGSLWYDADDTTGELFHQLGLSLETYGDWWDGRTNFYLPIDDVQRNRAVWISDLRFSDHDVLFDRSRIFSTAMYGGDVELGGRLPSSFAEKHDLRLYGGVYHFAGDDVDDITGVSVRFAGNVTDAITTQVLFTDDETFGTNVALGVAFQFPSGARAPLKGTSLRTFVRRNYNVIVSEQSETLAGLRAIDPATEQAYVVQHVASGAAAGGNGTLASPFRTIAQAQAAGGDIVFVHSGSVLGDPVALQSGTRVLGEGGTHLLTLPEFGDVFLPTATGGTARPTIQNAGGDAVTLTANSEFSGFVIDSPAGHGIVGTAVDGAVVRQVDVNGAGQDGVFLQNASGNVLFEDVFVSNATGAGFHVDGGAPQVVYTGGIANTTGRAFHVENTTGGDVDFSQASVTDTGGDGVRIANAAGDVVLGDVNVQNATGVGVDVTGGSGNVSFGGTTTVTATNGAGISVQNTTGTVAFANVNVTGDNQTALFARNAASLVVDAGTLRGVNGGAAADLEDSALDVSLASVFADGGPFGLRIVGGSGSFTVNGTGGLGTGGLIQNATTGILLDGAPVVALRDLDLDGNDVGIQASDTNTLVLLRNRVTDSTNFGLDLTNVKDVRIAQSVFTGNGDTSARIRYDSVGSYNVLLAGNTVTDGSAAAIDVRTLAGAEGSSLAFSAQGNSVTTTAAGADGIALDWDGLLNASFADNAFTGTGGTSDGIDLTAASLTEQSQISVLRNTFTFDGGTDTGLRLTTLGPSQIAVVGNRATFDAADGVGMNFTLAESASVVVSSNVVTDNVSSGTGILFTSVDGPSSFTIDDNLIQLLSGDGNVDRGIVFTAVNDTITLFGTQDNVVNGATTPFSIPVGTSTGWIFVNGAAVP